MDPLSHFFLPLIFAYALKLDEDLPDHHLLSLAFFGVIADGDVFLGIHRYFLHSPLLITLLIFLPLLYMKDQRRRYVLLAAFFMYSHVLLDFFDGGVPLFYPVASISIGLEFVLTMEVGGSLAFNDVGVRLILRSPSRIAHVVYPLITGSGIVAVVMYLLLVGRKLMAGSEGRMDIYESAP